MKSEKLLAKLMEEIKKQNFESMDEANAFISKLMKQNLDDLHEKTDDKGRSQDLVYEAYEQPLPKAKKLIKQALALDPDNAEAYIYLASKEDDLHKAIILYNKAIKAATKTLGKKFFTQHKGYFWGLIETRPYMRAKASLARCLYINNEIEKAISIYEELIDLNPIDNLGIRYLLSTLLLENRELNNFKFLHKAYKEENCAVWNFNNALYHFIKSGPTEKTKKVLLNAHRNNPYVVDYMVGGEILPDRPPQYIGRGDESEAVAYVFDAWMLWRDTEGALPWLYDFMKHRRRKK